MSQEQLPPQGDGFSTPAPPAGQPDGNATPPP